MYGLVVDKWGLTIVALQQIVEHETVTAVVVMALVISATVIIFSLSDDNGAQIRD